MYVLLGYCKGVHSGNFIHIVSVASRLTETQRLSTEPCLFTLSGQKLKQRINWMEGSDSQFTLWLQR